MKREPFPLGTHVRYRYIGRGGASETVGGVVHAIDCAAPLGQPRYLVVFETCIVRAKGTSRLPTYTEPRAFEWAVSADLEHEHMAVSA